MGKITLSSLLAQQQQWDQNSHDIVIRTNRLYIKDARTEENKNPPFRLAAKTTLASHLNHPFIDHALTQFCTLHTFERARWEAVSRTQNPEIRQTFVDHVNKSLEYGFGLKSTNPEKLVRIYTPSSGVDKLFPWVRAVLSSRYAPYPTAKLIERTIQACDMLDRKGVSFTLLSGYHKLDRIFIRLISESKRDHERGSLYSGVIIGNSGDGTAALTVEGFVSDSYCKNGLIFGQSATQDQKDGAFYKRHIGSVEMLQYRFNLALTDAFQMADEMAERFLGLHDIAVENPLDEIAKIVVKNKTRPGFSETLSKVATGLYPSYAAIHGDNKFSVVSSLTQAAQSLKEEERVNVERTMGALVAATTS